MNIKKFVKKHKREIVVYGLAACGAAGTAFIWYKLHTKIDRPYLGAEGDTILRVGVQSINDAMPTKVTMELGKEGKRAFAMDINPDVAIEIGEDLIETSNAIKAGTILDRMHL